MGGAARRERIVRPISAAIFSDRKTNGAQRNPREGALQTSPMKLMTGAMAAGPGHESAFFTLHPSATPDLTAALLSNTTSWPQASGYYWQQSRRPLTCLAFVAPLLVLYEGGVLWLGAQAMRNGADVWLRQSLDLLGFGQYFLLPALAIGILLGWHHTTQQPWRVSLGVLYAMWAECLLLALALVVIARLQGALLSMVLPASDQWPPPAAVFDGTLGLGGKLVSFFGAGIYEEVLFRLMLLPLAAAGLRWAGCTPRQALVGAVIATSILFSAAHYIGPHGQSFDASSFTFRLVAGGFFGVLFAYRGFGVAAGTHALYDILVGLCAAA